MSIIRYTASLDTTITNTFKNETGTAESETRATGSNLGLADILEVFSVYGRRSGSLNGETTELSRILIQFPISKISSDRTAGIIPASGEVDFKLKLYNARHPFTLPKNYDLLVSAVSGSWQEGHGLDLSTYEDETKDGEGSNWINANNNLVSASATLTALSVGSEKNTRKLLVSDVAGNSVNFNINNGLSTSTATEIALGNANNNTSQFATNIVSAINLAETSGTLNVTASASDATITLTQTAQGRAGNSAADIAGTAVTDSAVTVVSQFAGGDGKWVSVGGDYYSSPTYTKSFTSGVENVEIDVTTLVEQWIAGTKTNHGFGVRLSDSHEGYFSSSVGANSGSIIHNTSGAKKSFFTKTFFARSTEFFYKRPVLEAQFEDITKDDRNKFYLSSSLLPGPDNLNSLYFYNYIHGRLADYPGYDSTDITLKLFYSSGSVPEGSARSFFRSDNNSQTSVSATRVSAGVYKASIAVPSTIVNDTYPYLVDVWSIGSEQVFTGSAFTPIKFKPSQSPSKKNYVLSMPNLRQEYKSTETVRLRLHVREKNWSPTIYTVANSVPENITIVSGSYRIIRAIDDFVVVSHGTGSTKYTGMSYDTSGSYFDLDMNLFEPGYQYKFRYAFYDGYSKSYVEQPYEFKFRVIE